MTHRAVIRVGLAYMAVQSLVLGVWAVLAPRSFYDDFPGGGRSWVSVDGPFNEHLVRDVGALNLGLTVVLVAAAMRPTRALVLTAAVASLAWGIPHLLYHATNTDGYDAVDLAASLSGLALFALIPAVIVVLTARGVWRPPDG